jgi:hypothetical protein
VKELPTESSSGGEQEKIHLKMFGKKFVNGWKTNQKEQQYQYFYNFKRNILKNIMMGNLEHYSAGYKYGEKMQLLLMMING